MSFQVFVWTGSGVKFQKIRFPHLRCFKKPMIPFTNRGKTDIHLIQFACLHFKELNASRETSETPYGTRCPSSSKRSIWVVFFCKSRLLGTNRPPPCSSNQVPVPAFPPGRPAQRGRAERPGRVSLPTCPCLLAYGPTATELEGEAASRKPMLLKLFAGLS